ncbi:hypothetical protein [Paenibacillus humicus]|uniref:hypothetical protein n=1 Tax=Paenibacillus humicus TaxID=412861 RepID=UPI000FDC9A72|nr:hypothetical protein [Paenibacillus humicus]
MSSQVFGLSGHRIMEAVDGSNVGILPQILADIAELGGELAASGRLFSFCLCLFLFCFHRWSFGTIESSLQEYGGCGCFVPVSQGRGTSLHIFGSEFRAGPAGLGIRKDLPC